MTHKPNTSPPAEVTYTGEGAFINGVPARDMTLAEWLALPEELREQAKTLYSIAKGSE